MTTMGLKGLLPAPKNAWHDEMLDDLDDLDGSSKIIADSDAPTVSTLAVRNVAASSRPTATQTAAPLVRRAPPYLQRSNWAPRQPEDFDNGGAFPEIHIPQYPLKMGLKGEAGGSSGAIIPLEVDETGKVRYDALMKQGMRKGTWVHTGFSSLVEKVVTDEELMKPDEDAITEATERTRRELEKIVNSRIQSKKTSTNEVAVANQKKDGPTYLR